jgi:hypothetical protein
MTKEDILKLYIADLNNLVADSDAKRSRIIDLEDELEALKQGQSLPIDSVSNICQCSNPVFKTYEYTNKPVCTKCRKL